MTLNELIERLQDVADTTDGEREVYVAQQPAWPLTASVMHVWDPFDGNPDAEQQYGTDKATAVWIATAECRIDGDPYAPSAAYDGGES